MILAVAASPSVDVTYVVDEFRAGAQLRPDSVHRVAGGKAINAARAAAALGAEVRVVAALGGAGGDFIARELAARGIPLTAASTAHDTRTCVSVFSRADATLTEIYEHAAPIADAWPALLQAVSGDTATMPEARPPTTAPTTPPARWMLVSGSMPDTGTADPLAELFARAAAQRIRVAVDTHGPALRAALAAPADLAPALVKVNRAEAAAALGREGSRSAGELASELRDRTGGIAVVTDGEAGSAAADRQGLWSAQLPGVVGGYPVGSGDSYLGGLLTALDAARTPDQPAELADALRLATAAAAANAQVPGAAVFELAEVARLLPQVLVGAG